MWTWRCPACSRASTAALSTGTVGIYSDPSMRRSDLVEAQKAIEAALAVMRATAWPTNAEYDADEEARSASVSSS